MEGYYECVVGWEGKFWAGYSWVGVEMEGGGSGGKQKVFPEGEGKRFAANWVRVQKYSWYSVGW